MFVQAAVLRRQPDNLLACGTRDHCRQGRVAARHHRVRPEAAVRLSDDGVTPCLTYEIVRDCANQRIEIEACRRKCVFLYHYLMHPVMRPAPTSWPVPHARIFSRRAGCVQRQSGATRSDEDGARITWEAEPCCHGRCGPHRGRGITSTCSIPFH
jgi:hypothetical protein